MQHHATLRAVAAALIAVICPLSASAVTINFSSLEQMLDDPSDKNSVMTALWTGWNTQLYEYNMPFIEIENDSNFVIERFTMTIGDTDYEFSNEFLRKQNTNSHPFPADGTYAIKGYSTPDIELTSSIDNGGDLLDIDFDNGGLQPGEVVRFQVDINPAASGAMTFADYTSVFTNSANGNSELTFYFEGIDTPSSVTLSNFPVSDGVSQFLQNPRPYSVMQPIDLYPDTSIDPVPEPTAGLLAMLAAAGYAARRAR